MQITPPGFRRRDRLLPRFQVPPHRPGPTPTAVSSQAPPPVSSQQTPSCSQPSGAAIRPRLFPRLGGPLTGTSRPSRPPSSKPLPRLHTSYPADFGAPSPTIANTPVYPQPRLSSQPCLTSFRRPAVDALAHFRHSRSGAAGSPDLAPLRAVALGPRPWPADSLRPPPSSLFALPSQPLSGR